MLYNSINRTLTITTITKINLNITQHNIKNHSPSPSSLPITPNPIHNLLLPDQLLNHVLPPAQLLIQHPLNPLLLLPHNPDLRPETLELSEQGACIFLALGLAALVGYLAVLEDFLGFGLFFLEDCVHLFIGLQFGGQGGVFGGQGLVFLGPDC